MSRAGPRTAEGVSSMPSRGMPEWVLPVVLAGLCLLPLALVFHGDSWCTVRVVGRIVDADTGEPIVGATVLMLYDASVADDDAEVERRRKRLREWGTRRAPASRAEPANPCDALPFGVCETDADGGVDACLLVHWSSNLLTGLFRSPGPDPYTGCRALLVTWGDGQCALVDGTEGDWVVDGRGDFAALDLGDVELTGSARTR